VQFIKYNPKITFRLTLILFTVVIWFVPASMVMGQGISQSKENDAKNDKQALDPLLKRIEKRYAGPGFSAEFEQQSTISAMEITDSASGKLYVKRPSKMRWEYVLPETQIIISDSNDLWIYRPEDNQVLVGKAPSFFAHGKGATFLSDITNVRKAFLVTLEHPDKHGNPVLKLIPKKKSAELTEVHITISKHADTIDQIVTKNGYGDETRIQINKYRFNQDLAEELFVFEIPNGADVLQLDQQ
jgi:outer membrane lipoprotein carrier protein